MSDSSFFEISKEQSQVKAAIVNKYFSAWATVMMGTQDAQNGRNGTTIQYLDLFAGPGRYEDGTKSTPLLILETAIANEKLRNRLVTIFNDKDDDNTQSLQKSIDELPGVESLRYPPKVFNDEVGVEIVKLFESMKMAPTFFFVDPWGYKGLSLKLINAVLKDWGCDCVFFFNYNRINMGLPNVNVDHHMKALFGDERAERLVEQLNGLSPEEREFAIVEELCKAIKETGKDFVLPFRFRNDKGTRTSHHLIFVSKGFRGYEIMKGIMANECSLDEQGVPHFEYSPASIRQPMLFALNRPLDDLEEMLLSEYQGQTKGRDDIYEEHNVDRRYIKKNYTEVLLKLEKEGKIKINPTAAERKKGPGLSPKAKISFPKR